MLFLFLFDLSVWDVTLFPHIELVQIAVWDVTLLANVGCCYHFEVWDLTLLAIYDVRHLSVMVITLIT